MKKFGIWRYKGNKAVCPWIITENTFILLSALVSFCCCCHSRILTSVLDKRISVFDVQMCCNASLFFL